jgi:hypothetical protein
VVLQKRLRIDRRDLDGRLERGVREGGAAGCVGVERAGVCLEGLLGGGLAWLGARWGGWLGHCGREETRLARDCIATDDPCFDPRHHTTA